jgi:hypothetical protein
LTNQKNFGYIYLFLFESNKSFANLYTQGLEKKRAINSKSESTTFQRKESTIGIVIEEIDESLFFFEQVWS